MNETTHTLTNHPFQTVEAVARTSYGRLVAYLSSRSRDLAEAEDALADAFRMALETWTQTGVPQKPEAWLLTVARRKLLDQIRHQRVQTDAMPTLRLVAEEAQMASQSETFPDERLKLLFICAHPAIAASAHTPLMLQTVLGLDAARIASAFLIAPTTMGQRLVRAKAKIRDAGITFEVPAETELATRLDAVMAAIYAAYGTGWEDVSGADPRCRGLAQEAIWLARVLVQLMPASAEARGLLALMLHCEARRPARRSPTGDYVPLSEQDIAFWNRTMIDEAERELAIAAAYQALGRFQLEAAIQSVHAQRAVTQQPNWDAIALLYEALVNLSPTLGALVGRAAAVAQAQGAAAGLTTLEAIASESVMTYQPYWAVYAHLLAAVGRHEASQAAYTRAIGLSEDNQVREFLLMQSRSTTSSEVSNLIQS